MKPRIFCLSRRVKRQPPAARFPRIVKTIEQVREEFVKNGVSVAEWARAHGVKRHTVVDLLSGRRVGRRGEAHRAAVALGLKTDPEAQ